jgi:hypothetical protein
MGMSHDIKIIFVLVTEVMNNYRLSKRHEFSTYFNVSCLQFSIISAYIIMELSSYWAMSFPSAYFFPLCGITHFYFWITYPFVKGKFKQKCLTISQEQLPHLKLLNKNIEVNLVNPCFIYFIHILSTLPHVSRQANYFHRKKIHGD